MFVPITLGSDKTTVSVGTGDNEFWPLYGSVGNIHNNMRRAHGAGFVLIGFLAIPKGIRDLPNLRVLDIDVCSAADKSHSSDPVFRRFRRQLFHSSLSKNLWLLRSVMEKPEVVECCDGHYHRAIWGLGPYSGDYPEQVLLTCIVQGWCPRSATITLFRDWLYFITD